MNILVFVVRTLSLDENPYDMPRVCRTDLNLRQVSIRSPLVFSPNLPRVDSYLLNVIAILVIQKTYECYILSNKKLNGCLFLTMTDETAGRTAFDDGRHFVATHNWYSADRY